MWRPCVCVPSVAAVCIQPQLLLADALHPEVVPKRWNSNIKLTKQLKRMIDRSAGSKKKKIFPGPVNLGINSSENADLNRSKKPVYTEGKKRRAQQMSRVLYDNIVRLVNSGELCEELASLSVEIVKVKVVPDFSVAKVYWLSSGTENDDKVQSLLNKNAGHLRHLLTSLYVLGIIPRICFVRDDSQARYLEVETLLRKADFGPDFVPTRLDSNIREMWQARLQDRSTSEDQLQADFNALSIDAVTSHADPLQETFTVEGKAEFIKEETMEKGAEQETSDSDQRHLSGSGSTAMPYSVASEAAQTMDCWPRSALKTSPSQPSSLEVEQLGSQYGATVHNTADTALTAGTSGMVTEKAALLNNFRDDMYKVPYSELMNKVLMKKQKAGLRPGLQVNDNEFETVTPKVASSTIKSLLQKKAKSKGRLRLQSDYFQTDMVGMHGEDVDTGDDHEQSDDEIDDDDDFSDSDDGLHRK